MLLDLQQSPRSTFDQRTPRAQDVEMAGDLVDQLAKLISDLSRSARQPLQPQIEDRAGCSSDSW